MSPPVLTEEECCQERTADSLYRWLFAKIDLFSSLSQEDASLERQILLHEGLFKKFHEELYPLAIFASHWYGKREDVVFRPNFGCRNYDAEIVDHSGTVTHRVEITQSFFDRDEYRRMLYYLDGTRHELVWLNGPIDCEGTKRTGHRITQAEDYEDSEYWQNLYRGCVCNRLANKGTKPRGYYEPNTILVVAIDDYVKFVTGRSQTLLSEAVAGLVASPSWPFARTFLVGIAQKYFLEL